MLTHAARYASAPGGARCCRLRDDERRFCDAMLAHAAADRAVSGERAAVPISPRAMPAALRCPLFSPPPCVCAARGYIMFMS